MLHNIGELPSVVRYFSDDNIVRCMMAYLTHVVFMWPNYKSECLAIQLYCIWDTMKHVSWYGLSFINFILIEC